MSDLVFVCYARKDEGFVIPLAENLKRAGVPIWLDQWDIPAGADWDRSIDEAIYNCDKFLIVLSPLAVDSPEVRAELRTALDKKKTIIPVVYSACEIPRQLRTIQHVEFLSRGPDDEGALRRLLNTLAIATRSEPALNTNLGAAEENKPEGNKEEERRRTANDTDHERFQEQTNLRTNSTWLQRRLAFVRENYRNAHFGLSVGHAAALAVMIVGVVVWWNGPFSPRTNSVQPSANLAPSADPKSGTSAPAGSVFRHPLKIGGEGPEMIVVPAGTFQMGDIQGKGDENERPAHTVQIGKMFALNRFEVTFDEYDAFAKATARKLPSDSGWGRGRRPVINISWEDAEAYAKWLSEQTGKRYRLPTEAEWEYAARAGTKTQYWWNSDEIGKGQANCIGCGSQWDGKQSAPVGSFKANAFRLHDTAGNVWEWVEDCWHGNYNGAPTDGRAWKEENGGECGQRMLRGGSWFHLPEFLRSSFRLRFIAVPRNFYVGFRLAQDLS